VSVIRIDGQIREEGVIKEKIACRASAFAAANISRSFDSDSPEAEPTTSGPDTCGEPKYLNYCEAPTTSRDSKGKRTLR